MLLPLLMVFIFTFGGAAAHAQRADEIEEIMLNDVQMIWSASRIGNEYIGYDYISLVVSTDEGRTWRRRNYPDTLQSRWLAFDGDSVIYGLFSRISKYDDRIQLYRSTDQGRTFDLVSMVFDHGSAPTLTMERGRLLAGEYGSVYRESSDHGVTWRTIPSPPTRNKYAGWVFFGTDTIVACTEKGELFRSTDSGETWSFAHVPNQSVVSVIRLMDSSRIFLGSIFEKDLVSSDRGDTWSVWTPEFTDPIGTNRVVSPGFIPPMTILYAQDSNSHLVFYYSFSSKPFRRFELPICNDHASIFNAFFIGDKMFFQNHYTMQRYRVEDDTLAFDGHVTAQAATSINTAGAWDCSVFGAVDYAANAYVTFSGAQSWCTSSLSCGLNYNDVHWSNDTTMWISGMLNYGICSMGCLSKYNPSTGWFDYVGRNPNFEPLIAMEWADKDNAWLLSNVGIGYMTTDAGLTWTDHHLAIRTRSLEVIDLAVEDDRTVWVATTLTGTDSKISVSRDGGKTFTMDIELPDITTTHLIAVGRGGIVAVGSESFGTRTKVWYRDPVSAQWLERATFPFKKAVTSVAYNPKIDSVCLLVNGTLYIGNREVTSLRTVDLPSENTYLGVHSDACSGFLINLEGGALERYSPATSVLVSVKEQEVTPPAPIVMRRYDLRGSEVDVSATGHVMEVLLHPDGRISTRLIYVAE